MSGLAARLHRGRAAACLVAACLVAIFAIASGGGSDAQPAKPKPHPARHPKAPATAAATPPPPPAENLVVHGARRYQSAPMPNQAIHDPAEAMRDPATGAPIGRFGHAYMDANPVPPVNPALQGDQSPVSVGVQR